METYVSFPVAKIETITEEILEMNTRREFRIKNRKRRLRRVMEQFFYFTYRFQIQDCATIPKEQKEQ